MFASDIHGSALYAEKLLARLKDEAPQRLVLLGDILYHGPRNELPDGYAPKEVAAMLNALRPRPLCVRGNCEAEVDQMMLEFPVMAEYFPLLLDGRMAFISAYFDENTNKILKHLQQRIADKTGNDFMIRNNVMPHLTISAIEARNVDVLIPAFEKVCRERLQPLDEKGVVNINNTINIVSVGQLFPRVIYAAPVLNEYMMNLSISIYNEFATIPETNISKFYQPYSWMPHITLGKCLDKEQMRQAFAVLQDLFMPIDGQIAKIGLSTVNPYREVMSVAL